MRLLSNKNIFYYENNKCSSKTHLIKIKLKIAISKFQEDKQSNLVRMNNIKKLTQMLHFQTKIDIWPNKRK